MPTRNINLTEQLDEAVESRVNSGRYGNASEVVREALRVLVERDKEYETRLRNLRRAVQEGFDEIERGEGIVVSSRKELRSLIRKAGKTASAELAAERRRG